MARPLSSTAPRRHGLSGRLLRLSLAAVLVVEVLVFVPELAAERQRWLNECLNDAGIAVLAVTAVPGARLDTATASEVLRLARTEYVQLNLPNGERFTLAGSGPMMPTESLDLRAENFAMRAWRALRDLVFDGQAQVLVFGDSLSTGGNVSFVFQRHDETLVLRRFAGDFIWRSLMIASLTGALVYFGALMLLVRPMRRIIDSIAAFRADPERTVPLDAGRVANVSDEIALAERELAAMQNELRGALWRHSRLAALGTAVAKVSHDLGSILAPALLRAEALEAHDDEAVRRSGEILVRAIDQATDLVHRTLDFVREGPPPLTLTLLPLDQLVEEAGEAVRASGRLFNLANNVPSGFVVEVDRNQFLRVLVNLLRNAVEAGARTVRVDARRAGRLVAVDVADDGPGLPEAVQATLFRPFSGSVRHGGTGLGLAIVRDLMLTHGGDIALVSTGAEGTGFRLTLPAPETPPHDGVQPQAARVSGIAPADGADV